MSDKPRSGSRGQQLRRRLFEVGATALTCLAPTRRDEYACPLCAGLYTRADLDEKRLNLDHVPPRRFSRSVGIRPIEVLVCEQCNSRAGAKVDPALSQLAEVREFAEGRSEEHLPVRLHLPDIEHEFRALGQRAGNRFSFTGVERRNPPAMTRRFEDWFRSAAGAWSFHVSFQSPAARRIGLGVLRATYLTAFAAFGYRYILGPAFEPVRLQVKDPDATIVDPLPVFKGTIQGRSDPAITFLHEPFPAVMVLLDQSFVVFPSDSSDTAFHARAVRELVGGAPLNFRGVQIPWPRYPTYAFDREPEGL